MHKDVGLSRDRQKDPSGDGKLIPNGKAFAASFLPSSQVSHGVEAQAELRRADFPARREIHQRGGRTHLDRSTADHRREKGSLAARQTSVVIPMFQPVPSIEIVQSARPNATRLRDTIISTQMTAFKPIIPAVRHSQFVEMHRFPPTKDRDRHVIPHL
jgi:hypothetical protein